MKTYLFICITAFALLGLFLLGAMFGDVDDKGFAYMAVGAAGGGWFWYTTRDKVYFSRGLHAFFLLLVFSSWAMALLAAIYGVYGIITNRDIIYGQKFDGMAGMVPYIMVIFAILLLLVGLMFRWLAKRKVKKGDDFVI